MTNYNTYTLLGGIAGAAATALAYYKPSNDTIDNVVVPIGGFIAGATGGSIVNSAISSVPAETKAAAIAVEAVTLGAGYWAFEAWRGGKGHSDAGGVGIGFLTMLGVGIGLTVLDRATTKLLPQSTTI